MSAIVEVKGLREIQQALKDYPSISVPILQKSVSATADILLKNTTRETVPWRTGNLVQTFGWSVGSLWARVFPKANYAAAVERGSKPHLIVVINKKVLANKKENQIFGKIVNHPGSKPNPFMERILQKATPEINQMFSDSLRLINKEIVNKVK